MIIEAERSEASFGLLHTPRFILHVQGISCEIIPVTFYSDSERKSPMLRFQSRYTTKKERTQQTSKIHLSDSRTLQSTFPFFLAIPLVPMTSLTLTRIFSGEAANEILCYRHFIMGKCRLSTDWIAHQRIPLNPQTNEKEWSDYERRIYSCSILRTYNFNHDPLPPFS